MKTVLFAFSLLFALHNLNAQNKGAELVTDRPDQTESAKIVPTKSLQIETGAVIEWSDADNKSININSTLLRYGMADNFELRFGFGRSVDISSLNSGNTKDYYWLPIDCGFKVFISEQQGWIPRTAFLGNLSYRLNNGNNGFDADYINPSFRFTFANELAGPVSLGYNIGVHWDDVESKDRLKASLYFSFAAGISISDQLGYFAEIYGDFSDDQPNPFLFDTGITHLIRPNFQLDFSGGIRLNNNAPRGFISAGFSWLIPK